MGYSRTLSTLSCVLPLIVAPRIPNSPNSGIISLWKSNVEKIYTHKTKTLHVCMLLLNTPLLLKKMLVILAPHIHFCLPIKPLASISPDNMHVLVPCKNRKWVQLHAHVTLYVLALFFTFVAYIINRRLHIFNGWYNLRNFPGLSRTLSLD